MSGMSRLPYVLTKAASCSSSSSPGAVSPFLGFPFVSFFQRSYSSMIGSPGSVLPLLISAWIFLITSAMGRSFPRSPEMFPIFDWKPVSTEWPPAPFRLMMPFGLLSLIACDIVDLFDGFAADLAARVRLGGVLRVARGPEGDETSLRSAGAGVEGAQRGADHLGQPLAHPAAGDVRGRRARQRPLHRAAQLLAHEAAPVLLGDPAQLRVHVRREGHLADRVVHEG